MKLQQKKKPKLKQKLQPMKLLMITTEAMVTDMPQDDAAAPAMPDMGGMGGMGGMPGMM